MEVGEKHGAIIGGNKSESAYMRLEFGGWDEACRDGDISGENWVNPEERPRIKQIMPNRSKGLRFVH